MTGASNGLLEIRIRRAFDACGMTGRDYRIDDRLVTVAQVEIKVAVTLDAELVTDVRPGRPDHVAVKTPEEAESRLAGHADRAIAEDTGIRARLEDSLAKLPLQWLEPDRAPLALARLPQTYSLEQVCPDCSGKGTLMCGTCRGEGRIRCEACAGTGEVRRRCETCNGTGQNTCQVCHGNGTVSRQVQDPPMTVNCPACGGRGMIGETRCWRCNGSGRILEAPPPRLVRETCTACGGTGRSGMCHACRGNGVIVNVCAKCGGTGEVRCPTCGGAGEVGCRTCERTGWLTATIAADIRAKGRVAVGVVGAVADEQENIRDLYAELLADGAIAPALESVEQTDTGATARYRADIPFEAVSVTVDGQDRRLTQIGKSGRVGRRAPILDGRLKSLQAEIEATSTAQALPALRRLAALPLGEALLARQDADGGALATIADFASPEALQNLSSAVGRLRAAVRGRFDRGLWAAFTLVAPPAAVALSVAGVRAIGVDERPAFFALAFGPYLVLFAWMALHVRGIARRRALERRSGLPRRLLKGGWLPYLALLAALALSMALPIPFLEPR